jgi:RNA polymerase sigma factor (sigma-70 family)
LDCTTVPVPQAYAGGGTASLDGCREAVRRALDSGDVADARRMMTEAFAVDGSLRFAEEWMPLRDVMGWSDAWLVAGARQEPADVEALDALVNRYWKVLYGRCRMLTLDSQLASDLAQETWCRVLRARRALRPDGNFPAYLTTIATNLWRDWHRTARRAGPMAEHRMASLDAPVAGGGEEMGLADVLPDLNGLQADEQAQLKLDLDDAMSRLAPQLRDVLIARFLNDDSAAEIGRREGRTEQTISAWVRHALREMKLHLGESRRVDAREDRR